MARKCGKCGEKKSASEFYNLPGNTCKECRKRYQQEYLDNNPEIKERLRFRKSMIKIGLDPDVMWELYLRHSGLCDICGGPPDNGKSRLSADHDHETGEFRGFLCDSCNKALGLMRDSPNRLVRAARYLEGEYRGA